MILLKLTGLPTWIIRAVLAVGTGRFMEVLGCYPCNYQIHCYFLKVVVEGSPESQGWERLVLYLCTQNVRAVNER